MRLNEDVLRYMSIRVDEHEALGNDAEQSNRDDRDRDADLMLTARANNAKQRTPTK